VVKVYNPFKLKLHKYPLNFDGYFTFEFVNSWRSLSVCHF